MLCPPKVRVAHHLPDAIGQYGCTDPQPSRVHVHPPIQHLAGDNLMIDTRQMLHKVTQSRQSLGTVRIRFVDQPLQQITRYLLKQCRQTVPIIVRHRLGDSGRHITHHVLERMFQIDHPLDRFFQVEKLCPTGKRFVHQAVHQQHTTRLGNARYQCVQIAQQLLNPDQQRLHPLFRVFRPALVVTAQESHYLQYVTQLFLAQFMNHGRKDTARVVLTVLYHQLLEQHDGLLYVQQHIPG
uniref:Uncharacterized protein n=1 Tax=Anopheles christyi TaxID=43041 RepID=A0A182KHR6_9DIPT